MARVNQEQGAVADEERRNADLQWVAGQDVELQREWKPSKSIGSNFEQPLQRSMSIRFSNSVADPSDLQVGDMVRRTISGLSVQSTPSSAWESSAAHDKEAASTIFGQPAQRTSSGLSTQSRPPSTTMINLVVNLEQKVQLNLL